MEFKKCVIDSPYLCWKEGVFYGDKVFIIAEPPIYNPFHDDPCEPIAEVDGKFLYCINDCAIEEDCFVIDKNRVIIRSGCLWGAADVMSGEILLKPIYCNKWEVEEKMM